VKPRTTIPVARSMVMPAPSHVMWLQSITAPITPFAAFASSEVAKINL
jgi:hypothetical protein